MLLQDGELDGVRILKPETVRLMRTNQLTPAQRDIPFMGMAMWAGMGFGLGLSIIDNPERNWMGTGSAGAFSWPGAYGTWWQADPTADLILLYLVQNFPTFSSDAAAAVAGNTSRARLQAAQPKFVRRTYRALGL
jgi:CubicO group peptidase (beta-lactamase class C family)